MNTAGIIGHAAQIRRLDLMLRNRQVPQALLFTGISGIGKKLIARRFLSSLFCREDGPPCLTCASCRQAQAGSHPDLVELVPGEKGKILVGTHDKEEPGSVRWLINRLARRSITGNLGVIIDGMETVTPAGQNALLKTLEEPQQGTCIIIITAQRSQLLPTIISRCTEVPFLPLAEAEVAAVMAQAAPGTGEKIIADISGGSVERAMIMSDPGVRRDILDLCGAVALSAAGSVPFDADIARFQRNPGYDMLLDIMIGVYRHLYRARLFGSDPGKALEGMAGIDGSGARKLIKIFLALKKGLLNNLNIKMSLKGMLYDINSVPDGVPWKYQQ